MEDWGVGGKEEAGMHGKGGGQGGRKCPVKNIEYGVKTSLLSSVQELPVQHPLLNSFFEGGW